MRMSLANKSPPTTLPAPVGTTAKPVFANKLIAPFIPSFLATILITLPFPCLVIALSSIPLTDLTSVLFAVFKPASAASIVFLIAEALLGPLVVVANLFLL